MLGRFDRSGHAPAYRPSLHDIGGGWLTWQAREVEFSLGFLAPCGDAAQSAVSAHARDHLGQIADG
jgi:hypothetical protein